MAFVIKKDGDILGVYASQALAYADSDKVGDYVELTDAELAAEQRAWRNAQLRSTDWIVSITDHSERAAHITYRAALRDWPATDDFPTIRPTL